jgi:tetratricopeptide (TPR) repeat protein
MDSTFQIMNYRYGIIIFSIVIIGITGILLLNKKLTKHQIPLKNQGNVDGYVGSRSCRECHERFYDLWSPSHHGKAMQPVADVLLNEKLQVPELAKKVGDSWFKVFLDSSTLFMIEWKSQEAKEEINRFEAKWALGGRNIYYFLTPFEGGKLQTLPLAYDINRKEWYSNPESAVRHFVDNISTDEEVDWKHSLYTFNTTCHSCHVSQLNKNYDVSSNTYHTTWNEPGINCETCHGPCEEHIQICREAKEKDEVPLDLKIIQVKNFNSQQHNASCASCHAKGMPLTQAYNPGEPFFQHFNLITLESPDYYPDGRDLGENYTMASWYQSSCASNSDLHCVTCHTSSGRYRYKNNDNEICAKCHQDHVDDFEAHSHHEATDSITCISCHMPETEFARMTRSDHSMRPPMPATTIEFESPNACNICHIEEDASWSNKHVTEWHGNYQDETLKYARLIFQGRNNNFLNIDQMYTMINNPDINLIFRNSVIRILISQINEENENYFIKALQDDSPLIRASAAEGLGFRMNVESKKALLNAAQDSVLVVRNRASSSLASYPRNMFNQEEWNIVESNFKEYEDFLMANPDSWSAHYNLGNYYQGRGMHQQAIKSYDKAVELEEEAVMPLVNSAMAYSILGHNLQAEEKLTDALKVDPKNSAANLNYGLLLAQTQRFDQSKTHLIRALDSDSTLSVAAYNLAVITSQSSLTEALKYISLAHKLDPNNAKYGYTFAFYSYQDGNNQIAISTLLELINSFPNYTDAYLFLGNIYEETKNIKAAIGIYERATKIENIPAEYRQNIQMKANSLKHLTP